MQRTIHILCHNGPKIERGVMDTIVKATSLRLTSTFQTVTVYNNSLEVCFCMKHHSA